MSTSAWEALADAVVSAPVGAATASQVAAALRHLGLGAEERQALDQATAGREDPAGTLLRDLVETADPAPEGKPPMTPPWDVPAMDAAIVAAEQVRGDPGMAYSAALEALPPEHAGDLVLHLVRRARGSDDPVTRTGALEAAVAVSLRAPMTRLPVAELLATARGADEATTRALGAVLGRAPRTHVLRGLATALATGVDPSFLVVVGAIRWPEPGHPSGAETPLTSPEATGATPPPAAVPPPVPAPAVARPQGVAAPAEEPVHRSGPVVSFPGSVQAQPPPPPRRRGWWRLPSWGRGSRSGSASDVASRPAPGVDRGTDRPPAYPRVDLETGTDRLDVVVLGRPFTVAVGLAARPAYGLVSAGAITVAGPELELEAVLVYDPQSLQVEGGTRHRLRVTEASPSPAVTVRVTAQYLPDGPQTRRIGVQYLHAGQVVGMAWRVFVAVENPSLVEHAPSPPAAEHELLDLAPLLEADAPDLVLAVVASDAASDRWVWTVYSTDPGLPLPDAPNAARLDGDVAGFALATRRSVQYSGDPVHDYYTLTGRARRIGASMPRVVHEALGTLLAQPGRTGPPSVLLLTEELLVPWELASLDPPVRTPWGGTSAFLGAHAALGRWPLTEHRPRPVPRSSVTVRSAAVVTGDYAGVPGWGRLRHAEEEAEEVAGLFTPPAARVRAELRPVIDLLRGQPPADLIHVALHGQFDHLGEEEGILLVRRDGPTPEPQFLTPVQVENGSLAGSFVFLNACQVGSDERVLGSYGGFASTLLRVGAAGVVAPLWNVEDKVAADIARHLYADALGPDAVPVSEAVRRIRATYTEEAVVAGGPEGASATLVAFQVFGHPRLTLRRES